MPALEHAASLAMRERPVRLTSSQAQVVLKQFHETADRRAWRLLAVAIMWNHVHIVVGVPGDPDPSTLLRDFKSYASRELNRHAPVTRRRWWTESGSRRRLPDEPAVIATMRYVRDQWRPLVAWIDRSLLGVDEPS